MTRLVTVQLYLKERVQGMTRALTIIELGDDFAYSDSGQRRRMQQLRDDIGALGREIEFLELQITKAESEREA